MDEENDIQNETNHLDNDFEYHKSIQDPVQKPRKRKLETWLRRLLKS